MKTSMKKKRVSKKLKSSWRKHVNITDIEEFIADQRQEEQTRSQLETLPNEQLFQLDSGSSEQRIPASRKRGKTSVPKCFSSLQSFAKPSHPITKKNQDRQILKKKKYKPTTEAASTNKKNEQIEFNHNIWTDENPIKSDEWFSVATSKHNLPGTEKAFKTQKSKSRDVPTIEMPHPGMSYNPSFEDHQKLLSIISEKELNIIKQEKHLKRVTKDMFGKVSERRRDEAWLEEMSQGLMGPAKSDNVESDSEYKAVNPPTKNKKKTLQQRRKQKEQKQLQMAQMFKKIAKQKHADIANIRKLKKHIDNNDMKTSVSKERRKINKLLKKEPKRLNAVKFEETELDFNLSSDISGNLRNMKKEGNLLADRFKSMQKRNIIAPSMIRMKRRAKVKRYTKPGHKEDWIITVAKA